MKHFEFIWEDGPHQGHRDIIEAVNYSQALRKLKDYIQSTGRWDRVGYHNIQYIGMTK